MVNLKDLKKVKSFDIEEFDGVKSKIESVELSKIEEKDFGDGMQRVQQIIIKSLNLSDDKEKPITAIEYVPLKFDTTSNEFVIADSPKSKAIKLMRHFKVDNIEDLINKDCLVVKKQRESGKEFLGIHFG